MSSGSRGVHTGVAISEQKAACESYVQTHQLDILLRDVLNEVCFLNSTGKLEKISPYLKLSELITESIYRDELERLENNYSTLRQRKRKVGSGFKRDIAVPAMLSARMNPDKKTTAQTDANMFLIQHGLKEFLPNLLNDLILQRRENPKLFMIEACLERGGTEAVDQFDPILRRFVENPKLLAERPAIMPVQSAQDGEVDPWSPIQKKPWTKMDTAPDLEHATLLNPLDPGEFEDLDEFRPLPGVGKKKSTKSKTQSTEEQKQAALGKQTSDSYDTDTGLDTETEFAKGIPGFQPVKKVKHARPRAESEDQI